MDSTLTEMRKLIAAEVKAGVKAEMARERAGWTQAEGQRQAAIKLKGNRDHDKHELARDWTEERQQNDGGPGVPEKKQQVAPQPPRVSNEVELVVEQQAELKPDPEPQAEQVAADSPCTYEADLVIIKADQKALKLWADRTDAKVADLFAGFFAKEANAALFADAIGRRRRAQAESCRGESLLARVGQINSVCCGGAAIHGGHRLLQGDADCELPTQCTLACAPVFIVFREECEEMLEEAGMDMSQVERLYESCLEQESVDEGTCGAQIGRRFQRVGSAADTVTTSGATMAMIIPLTIVTNTQTGMLEVLGQTGRRLQQGGAHSVQEFRYECGSGADISACIPVCDESIHGFELLLTIDQSDLRVSCKLHAGLYSWAGAVSEGSYFGDDDDLFISTLVTGAMGRYSEPANPMSHNHAVCPTASVFAD